MDNVSEVAVLLREVLQLPAGVELNGSTPLLGELPELDSMAVVNVLTAMEEQFDLEIEDDEVSASIFESVDTLAEFLAEKTGNK